MRVTDRMIFDSAAERTLRAREEAEQATQEVTTGRRVVHPGDDPAAAALMSTQKMAADRADSIAKTTSRASDELQSAYDALNGLNEVFSRAKELAVQFGNDTYDAGARATGAPEVDSLFREAVSLLNSQMGDRYIFGGNKDAAPPFDAAGNYGGDAGLRQIEIAPGILEPVSVRADVVAKGVGGGTDVLATLTSLATAMRNNDGNAIRSSLTQFDGSIHQLSLATAQVSSTVETLQTAQTVSRAAKTSAETEIAALGDADIVQASSRLALANHALEAALTASAKSFQLSLLNKL